MTIIDQRYDVVGSARAFADEISARAGEAEQARSVPPDLMLKLRRAGLLKMLLPRSLGGVEANPLVALDAVEEVARADGSTGWSVMILNGILLFAWLDPSVAKELLAPEPDATIAGNLGPLGRATDQEQGIVLDGRWPFCSGSVHAEFLLGGYFTFDGGAPLLDGLGRPDWRIAVFPATDGQIHDTWHTAGLRATASNDVSVASLSVPAELTFSPFAPANHDAPLFRWSLFATLGILLSGVPLGVARRALSECHATVLRKSRSTSGQSLATEAGVQLALARAEADLRAARGLVVDAIGQAWDAAVRGDSLDIPQRAHLRFAYCHAMDVGVRVVDTAFRIGGGAAIYNSSPLQRCWRDLHAGSQHIFYSDQYQVVAASALFDLPTDDRLF